MKAIVPGGRSASQSFMAAETWATSRPYWPGALNNWMDDYG